MISMGKNGQMPEPGQMKKLEEGYLGCKCTGLLTEYYMWTNKMLNTHGFIAFNW